MTKRTESGDTWSALREEFVAWYVTPPRMRRQLNLPRTQEEFADMKGVSDRTIRRWKSRPEFDGLVEQAKRRQAGAVSGAAIAASVGGAGPVDLARLPKPTDPDLTPPSDTDDPVWEPGLSRDEFQYRQAKDSIFQKAAKGDANAFDLMMKYWGKGFVEQEQAEATLFHDLSDDELMAEVCNLLGPEMLASYLAESAVALS